MELYNIGDYPLANHPAVVVVDVWFLLCQITSDYHNNSCCTIPFRNPCTEITGSLQQGVVNGRLYH